VGTAAARREGCQALERSLESFKRMQAEGPLTADAVTNKRDLETALVPCRSASR
jgi:hypothetical protein